MVLIFGVSLFNVHKYNKMQKHQKQHRHENTQLEMGSSQDRRDQELTQLATESFTVARRV